jgi:DNA-binding MarR family transcriptional regulator
VRDQFHNGSIVLDNAIGFWLHRAHQALRNEMYRAFREAGEELTPEQWAVLVRLWEQDARTQTELADTTFRDKPTMSRLIDGLERNGLVARRSDKEDGRTWRVCLTAEGRALEHKLVPVAEHLVRSALQGIPEQDLVVARRVLTQIFQNVAP